MAKKNLTPLRKNITWVVFVQGGPEFTMSSLIGKSVSFLFEFENISLSVSQYALFQCISKEIDELRDSSATGFHRVAYSGGISPPDDLSDADALCEWLDQRKIIDVELHKLKDMMESAHHLEIHGKGQNEKD